MDIRTATKDDISQLEGFMDLPWVAVPPGQEKPEDFNYIEDSFDRGVIIYCVVDSEDHMKGMMVFNPETREIEVSAMNNGNGDIRITMKLFEHVKSAHSGGAIYAETFVSHYEMNILMHRTGFLAKPHPTHPDRFYWSITV